jgi:hypothetical protein
MSIAMQEQSTQSYPIGLVTEMNLSRSPEEEQQWFERNQTNLTDYIECSRKKIQDKATTILELEDKKSNLIDLESQLSNFHKKIFTYKTWQNQYYALPELNTKEEILWKQALQELRSLITSTSQKIKIRKNKSADSNRNGITKTRVASHLQELKTSLSEFGFFDLPLVSHLSHMHQNDLFKLISNNKLPYQIAMLDFLGFIDLVSQHFNTHIGLQKKLSKILGSDKNGRAVRGNLNSLSSKTAEDLDRYTARKHKLKVQNDYNQLK